MNLINYSLAMDTSVIYLLLKKIYFYSFLILLLLLCTACPGEEDCFDLGTTSRVNDLILLTPKQTEYSQGDEVTLSLSIPANNSYFGNEINLFHETGDNSALLALGFNQLFIGNQLNILIGTDGNSENMNWYYAVYNENNETYELEIEIYLNRVGEYSFLTDDSLVFDGGQCNIFRLDTNVLWEDIGIIEFTVVE